MTGLAVIGWTGFALVLWCALRARVILGRRAEEVARACHEVRGPLAAARLGLGLPVTGAGTALRLRAIEAELGRAAVALNDLEGVSHRLRAERRAELVDVEAWLRDSVEAWRPAAAVRGTDVTLRWRGPSARVLGERGRFSQATGNLIANAVEHGGGPVEVRGWTVEDRVRIEVVDGGPGLRVPLAHLLTSTPRRGRASRRAERRGHGLSIAHDVATAHGGRLAAAPSLQGARLVLEFPLANSPARTQAST